MPFQDAIEGASERGTIMAHNTPPQPSDDSRNDSQDESEAAVFLGDYAILSYASEIYKYITMGGEGLEPPTPSV